MILQPFLSGAWGMCRMIHQNQLFFQTCQTGIPAAQQPLSTNICHPECQSTVHMVDGCQLDDDCTLSSLPSQSADGMSAAFCSCWGSAGFPLSTQALLPDLCLDHQPLVMSKFRRRWKRVTKSSLPLAVYPLSDSESVYGGYAATLFQVESQNDFH